MTAQFWDNAAKHYDIQQHDHHFETMLNRTKAFLKPSDNVLDFACATGEISMDLAQYVQQVHGIDISAKMIDLAKQKATQSQLNNLCFEQGDAFLPSLPSKHYSAIFAFNIFHLLEDLPKTLNRLHHLLASGGLLITRNPYLSDAHWFVKSGLGLLQKLGIAPRMIYRSSADFQKLLTQTGFELVETENWGGNTGVYWIVARKT